MPWFEYRIVRSSDARRSDPLRTNYAFIHRTVLPMLTRHSVQHCLVLNYFEPGQRDYIRVRVEATDETLQSITKDFDSMKGTNEVFNVEGEAWSPEDDARSRIKSVQKNLRAGGSDSWALPGGVLTVPRDMNVWLRTAMWSQRTEDQMVDDLARLLEMVGGWSREFIEQFENRPEEGFLLSLLIHLFLNGLGFSGPSQGEEATIRFTPLVP